MRFLSFFSPLDDPNKRSSVGPSDIYKITKMIMVKNYNPVIVFAFSKRECEGLALQMSKLEFNTDEERDMVHTVFTNAISNLSDDDRQLPQIEHILPLLKRGIGIHHGGLLPILKEVIEILFQEGLLKVLFATETFSIGLNMPAKTVVFTSVRKFDGRDFRNLSGGEYIQMSGRAGRRGLDDRGIVIMMTDEKLEPAAAKGMVKGQADRLDSAFHLGYNMILNLMRVEGLTPEYMLERSFYQFQNTASVPKLEDGSSSSPLLPFFARSDPSFHVGRAPRPRRTTRRHRHPRRRQHRRLLRAPSTTRPPQQGPPRRPQPPDVRAAVPSAWSSCQGQARRDGLFVGCGGELPKEGRSEGASSRFFPSFSRASLLFERRALILVGLIVSQGKPLPADEPPQNQYIVDVLLHLAKGTAPAPVSAKSKSSTPATISSIRPCPPNEDGEFAVVPVLLSTLDGISHIRIFLQKDLKPLDARMQALKSVKEVKRRFPDGIALLDPVENMGIVDEAFKKLLRVRLPTFSSPPPFFFLR